MINVGVNVLMCHTLLLVFTAEIISTPYHANKAIKIDFSIMKII
jgi:hypothetical protein